MSAYLLKAEGLRKSFFKGKKEIPVVKGIDLELQQGETVAIMGASGAGKSTLLHLLGTLEKPTAGSVFFSGQKKDLFHLSSTELAAFRNHSLGFVFQFHYLLPEFSALENVMMPSLVAGHSQGTARQKALELLEWMGLQNRLEHRPSELSGGEQQRVAIARAVVLKPQLLLADELTGNLDSAHRGVVMDLLQQLNRQFGISLLLVTHDLEVAKRMGRLLWMQDGIWTNPPRLP